MVLSGFYLSIPSPAPLPGQEEAGEMEKETGEWVQGLVQENLKIF